MARAARANVEEALVEMAAQGPVVPGDVVRRLAGQEREYPNSSVIRGMVYRMRQRGVIAAAGSAPGRSRLVPLAWSQPLVSYCRHLDEVQATLAPQYWAIFIAERDSGGGAHDLLGLFL